MDKFISFCKKAFLYPLQLRQTHPVTAVSVTVTTLLFAVYSFIMAILDYDVDSMYMDLFFCICMSVLYFSVFSLCVESIRIKRYGKVKYAVLALLGALSVLMAFVMSDFAKINHHRSLGILAKIRNGLGDTTIILYITGLMAISVILAVYFSYSHEVHQRFNEHVLNANARIFFSSIIYGVIQCGVLFLTIIVTVLLYDDAFEFLPSILILINGLFFAPSVICAITRQNEKANIFIQILVRYVMLIITMIAFAIIYIYMIKLVVTASVPSNSVYAILTALFIESMFVSYMCTVFEENGFLQKFAYNCPLIFAPFILMQCYTVIVRIGQYGLTPKRYFGIAFIIFEIIYIVYYTVSQKRDHETVGRNLLLVMCSIAVIVLFIPGVNGISLSRTLSRSTLSSYLKKVQAGETISDREYMHANAAYGFLTDRDFGNGDITGYFAELDRDTVLSLREKAADAAKALSEKDRSSNDDPDFSDVGSGWFSSDLSTIAGSPYVDISGYSKLAFVNINDDSQEDSPTIPVDPSKLTVTVFDNTTGGITGPLPGYETADLGDFCSKFIELSKDRDADLIDYDEYNSKCTGLCLVELENARLYITSADISYNRHDEPFDIRIEGYLFY